MNIKTYIKVFSEQVELTPIEKTSYYTGDVTWCSVDGRIAKDKYGWNIEPVTIADRQEAIEKYIAYRLSAINPQ